MYVPNVKTKNCTTATNAVQHYAGNIGMCVITLGVDSAYVMIAVKNAVLI